ncbi:MAG TPA: HAMP domain-containing sensor histidine kinase, partial [Kofleriaceae bacterium]|nr:HAMP domain-containing sensor histidine kinase [Kofleriaceae bacterium]
DLSEPDNIAGNSAFRRLVVLDLVDDLTPSATPVIVAEAKPIPTPRAPPPRPRPRPGGEQEQVQQQAQVIEVDPNVYVQNMSSNQVYWQQLENNNQIGNAMPGGANVANAPPPQQVRTPPQPQTGTPTTQDASPAQAQIKPPVQTPPVQRPPAQRPPQPAEPPPPITITISPLEWRTLTFGGKPTLIAVRNVQTPDGTFSQGFVVDRSALTSALAAKAGEMVAELHDGDRASGVDIAPGWQLTVTPNPRTLARAAGSAADIARSFVIRFVAVGSIAFIAAALILLLVMRAEKLARERSQFAAAAAHELRTPLAGLQLYGDMLADGLGDQSKVRDYARRMSEEASRLGRVVSNVLGFSQLERGNLAVDSQVGPLGEALRELAERAEPALDRAGAALELDVAPDLRARFDRDALARIVGNLLDNAEKYARGADDRTIRLAAADRGNLVEVIVQDHGPGVADRAKLFRAFSRGVAADGPAGLGLGLALSQSLAEAMGGKLDYRPGDGAGATFVLELPRA